LVSVRVLGAALQKPSSLGDRLQLVAARGDQGDNLVEVAGDAFTELCLGV
jgi:hypothetical protein